MKFNSDYSCCMIYYHMINSLFIEYETFLDANMNFIESSIFALKKIISKVDDIRIVCLGTKDEIEKISYDNLLPQLSQALNLKKSLFFDKIEVRDWNDQNDVIGKISSWMSVHEVKSFAIVSYGRNDVTRKSYPNNSICCDPGSFSEANANDVIWIMSNYKNNISNDENIWFVSDTHFGHANIIKYCNRPWNSGIDENGELIVSPNDVVAMDNEMIQKWNNVVGKNDIVWHLGDFALGGKEVAERVFPQLNGKINLVMGNHDHYKVSWYYDLGFHRVYDRKVIINEFVILTHAPLQFLNNNCPFYQIFGHVHNSDAYQTWTKNSCCACVERHDYAPISWKMIKQKYDELNGKDE